MIDENVICKGPTPLNLIQPTLSAKKDAQHRLSLEKWTLHSGFPVKERSDAVLTFPWQKMSGIPKYFRTVIGYFYKCAIYYKSIEPPQELYV